MEEDGMENIMILKEIKDLLFKMGKGMEKNIMKIFKWKKKWKRERIL